MMSLAMISPALEIVTKDAEARVTALVECFARFCAVVKTRPSLSFCFSSHRKQPGCQRRGESL
jgi:hypothetical protein